VVVFNACRLKEVVGSENEKDTDGVPKAQNCSAPY
jgi:hypothetical protein